MNKYQQLANIKAQIKDLTEKSKQLEEDIFEEVLSQDGSKLETPYATFSIMYRPKWKYSKELLEKEKLAKDKLKIMKKEEELGGVAEKISDGGSLRVQLVNKENK